MDILYFHRVKEIVCNGFHRIQLTQDMVHWLALFNTIMNLTDSGYGPLAGSFQHDNEPSGSIKDDDV
jgi:hypothetical protein